jgi:hypothetical protein
MPVIARFYGILVKMYFSQREHGVPHNQPRRGLLPLGDR